MSERKSLVYCTSLITGAATAMILTVLMLKLGIGYWFIPAWPGMLLAALPAIFDNRQTSTGATNLLLVTTGNAIVYARLSLHILRAEVQARGHLSRYFLR
jgi:hypothetical protein